VRPCGGNVTRTTSPPPERLEQLVDVVRRDLLTGVRHHQQWITGSGRPAGRDLGPAAGDVVPDRVLDQVHHQPLQQHRVAGRHGRGELRPQRHTRLGGLVGLLLGASITAAYASSQGWPVAIPLTALAGGLGATLVIGAIAGLYPAVRTSRLDPIEALATP
jgi:hypothetical protein